MLSAVVLVSPSKFLDKNHNIMAATYFNQFLNVKPSIHELCEHVRVNTKWYKFGVLLSLDTTKLDTIRVMTGDDYFKALKMFELWLNTNPKATRREIIETLTKKVSVRIHLMGNAKKH